MIAPPRVIWLRAETKPGEARTIITPRDAARLVDAGIKVVVERSPERAFADDDYRLAGCELDAEGHWINAPGDAWILGLKALPEEAFPLRHGHLYFAHAFKGQPEARDLLKRFKQGGGILLDLEYLVDDNNRRLVAFGYWAGFVGAGLAVKAWIGQQSSKVPALESLAPFEGADQFIDTVKSSLDAFGECHPKPAVLIIGAAGRSGNGARAFLEAVGLDVTGWDVQETAEGGPFGAILEFGILVNCALLAEGTPPFITQDLLMQPDRNLSVISDVSCDPYSANNPIPLYAECTTLRAPLLRVFGDPPVDLIAIDHLPTLLPREASESFSGALTALLLDFDPSVWGRAEGVYRDMASRLDSSVGL